MLKGAPLHLLKLLEEMDELTKRAGGEREQLRRGLTALRTRSSTSSESWTNVPRQRKRHVRTVAPARCSRRPPSCVDKTLSWGGSSDMLRGLGIASGSWNMITMSCASSTSPRLDDWLAPATELVSMRRLHFKSPGQVCLAI